MPVWERTTCAHCDWKKGPKKLTKKVASGFWIPANSKLASERKVRDVEPVNGDAIF